MPMTEDEKAAGLAELLSETGRMHHEAFAATDGVDPEWPLWYARYLQTKVETYLGTDPTRSKIVQCLLNADDAHNAERPGQPWPTFYANYLLGLGQGGLDTSRGPRNT
jgi:hypothetical protein